MKTIETLYIINKNYSGELKPKAFEVKFTAQTAAVSERTGVLGYRNRFTHDRARELLKNTAELASKKFVAGIEENIKALRNKLTSEEARLIDAKKQLAKYL